MTRLINIDNGGTLTDFCLVDGEAAGAVNRVPSSDDIRANMVRGGAAASTELTAREREICATIGPELKRRGLVFVGFPLHPAGKPSQDRAKHLAEVMVPMLFLQGTRDALAELTLLEPLCKSLGKRATLKLFADADHSFHVPVKSGRKDADVFAELLDITAAWIRDHAR